MVRPSTQTKLAEALQSLGAWEDTKRSAEYRVFRHDVDPTKWFFIGKGGSLRSGLTIQNSSAAYLDKVRLLAEWDMLQKAIIQRGCPTS